MPLINRKAFDEAVDEIYQNLNMNVKGVYISGLSNLIFGTPVDEGLHRNSWFLSVGVPSNKKTKSKSTSGSSSYSELSKMPTNVLNKKIFFTNSAPGIISLEYGGFPNPVKKGSYIKKTKSYQILSINGYSKQQPTGWVRSAVLKMQNKVRTL